jgi:PAS domain S-box-containing protein
MGKDTETHYLQRELYELVQTDESIFEFLQRGSLDGVWYWDITHPENEWMSPRFWELLGFDPTKKEHLAKEWQDLINTEDLEVALSNYTKHCADPKHPYDQTVRYRHKDGSTVWVRCRGIAIRDHTGKPIRLLGAHTDLTELKRTEETLKQRTIELEASNQSLKRAEGELRKASKGLEQQVQARTKELRDLSGKLIRTQEAERRRISLELHDRLGQDLALLSIQIERLIQKAPESQAQLNEQLQALSTRTKELSSKVQTLSHELHPSQLVHLGLVAASRSLCHEVSQSSDIQIDFSHSDVSRSISPEVSTCLYRVLQESLTNVVKHSGAKTAQVELAGSPSEIQLQILDSGVGFDPKSTGSRGGLGLVGMRERLSLLGGELLIESRPSGSTWIKACLPLSSS